MADHHEEDELAPTQTAGYKVGEKKTLEEYETLDAHDESLKKWKQSLGLGQASGKLESPFFTPPFSITVRLLFVDKRFCVRVILSLRHPWLLTRLL
jgi:hypothetical protein